LSVKHIIADIALFTSLPNLAVKKLVYSKDSFRYGGFSASPKETADLLSLLSADSIEHLEIDFERQNIPKLAAMKGLKTLTVPVLTPKIEDSLAKFLLKRSDVEIVVTQKPVPSTKDKILNDGFFPFFLSPGNRSGSC